MIELKSVSKQYKIAIKEKGFVAFDRINGADMIIVLDDGKIDGIGTNDELIKNNTIYRDIVNVQKKGGKLGE